MRSNSGSILVVDDEQGMRDFLSIYLTKEGFEVASAESGESAVKAAQKKPFDLVITDLQMQGIDGIETLKQIKSISPSTEVVIITAHATMETGVEAMKEGAMDYITKPFNLDQIKIVVSKVFERQNLVRENKRLKQEVNERYNLHNLIGRSQSMKDVYEMVEKVAGLDSTILIRGESGTGKELVARAIHHCGNRSGKSFVACNCGAFPENLLESELFGYKAGAFTDAKHDRAGLVAQAEKGTLFLDEIGETSLAMQVKFLRFLQEKNYRRVGDTKDIPSDVRIISATNANLEEMVQEGTFREDLYYRLNVIQIRVPPLRERKNDIVLLVDHFLRKFCDHHKKEAKHLTPEAVEVIKNHNWPGNVRQLENFVEQMVVLESATKIEPHHLPATLQGGLRKRTGNALEGLPEDGIDFQRAVEHYEKDLVEQALRKTKGVKKEAANLLKISLRSLRYQLVKHKIDPEEKE